MDLTERASRVGDVLRRATEQLAAAGCCNPADVTTSGNPEVAQERLRTARTEAEWLLEWVTGWSRVMLLLHLGDVLPTIERGRYEEAIARRLGGEPVAYIVGAADFYGRAFTVRPGCLIPRPETEVLAEAAIALARQYPVNSLCVDFGTGSGALAATMQLECPHLRVVGVDVSADALTIASANGARLMAAVEWVQADGFEWLRGLAQAGGTLPAAAGPGRAEPQAVTELRPAKLRLLVSNPPYIPSSDIGGLSRDVRDFEPHLALDGGLDGLDFYRALADLGPGIFAPGAAGLLLEVGFGQAQDVKALFRNDSGWNSSGANSSGANDSGWTGWVFDVLPDLRGIDRVVRGVRTS